MKKLKKVTGQLTDLINRYDWTNKSISEASVGWHIAHCYLVINSITAALKKSNPSDYRYSFDFSRLYVWTTGSFPRGRGKAPEQVKPIADITPALLQELAAKTMTALAVLPELEKNACFKHPYFGWLNKKSSIRFLEIHTKHHYKIIMDMLG